MSGQQPQQFDYIRQSAPNAENARFGRYPAQNQKSAGVITTVYQQQQYRRTMMNQDSSDPNQFQQMPSGKLAATTSSGFVTEDGPRGTEPSNQKGSMPLVSHERSPVKNVQ